MLPVLPHNHAQLMQMAIVAHKGDLFTAPLWLLIANHQIHGTWRGGDGAQIDMFPGIPGFHIQFMDMPILTNIGDLLTSTL